jgi:hypothetical protein
MYQDQSVTESFESGKHCSLCFTHEAAKDMTMDLAKEYAQNVLSIIQSGAVPPITEVHAARVLGEGFPPLMPQAMIKQYVKTFDPADANKSIQGLFTKYPSALRVEKIATSMGCVITTCVAEVEHLPMLTEGIIAWAKPIIEVNSLKAKVCLEWRKKLELGGSIGAPGQQMQVKVIGSELAADSDDMAERMQIGAMFSHLQ